MHRGVAFCIHVDLDICVPAHVIDLQVLLAGPKSAESVLQGALSYIIISEHFEAEFVLLCDVSLCCILHTC